jgi:hypothetical protein
MKIEIHKWLNNKYPQNYIIKSPIIGTLIIAGFFFGFTVLYKPFNTHASRALNYETTMAFYSFLSAIFIFISLKLLKTIKYFSNSNDWTVFKELLSVIIVLLVLGIAIYLLGFIMETSAPRWNISTFLNSLTGAFLTGIIPFTFFSAINYRYLFWKTVMYNDESNSTTGSENPPHENLIQINSQLKKEELSFYPSQFLYAESDGNYVVFYLTMNGMIKDRKSTRLNSRHP